MADLPSRLRFFLRSRCGSLKAAFSALDASDQGRLTQQDFEAGLKKLGFAEDVRPVFTSLQEASASGEITLKTFVSGIMGSDMDETMARVPAAAWSATPRCHSDSNLPPTLLPKPSMQGGLSMPVKAGSRAPSQGLSDNVQKNLDARIKHLEDQLVMEQSQRLETELRLTEYVHRAISEEFDVIKRELRQEQVERRAMKAELQDLRSRLCGASFAHGADAMNRLKQLEGKLDLLDCPDDAKTSATRSLTLDGTSATKSLNLDATATTRSLTLDACSIQSGSLGESATPGMPQPGLTPRTLLRQENLKLREENLSLREQAVEVRERDKALHAQTRQRSLQRDVDCGHRAESPVVPQQNSRAASPSLPMQSPPRPRTELPQSPNRGALPGKGLPRQAAGTSAQHWKGATLPGTPTARKGSAPMNPSF